MKRLLLTIALTLTWAQANAAVTTLNILDAASATKATAWDQDGSSRYFSMGGIYGLAGDYQVDVTSGNALKVDGSAVTQPVMLYAAKENFWRATLSLTGTSGTFLGAQGAGVKIYVTGAQCYNSSATSVTVTLSDTEDTGSGTILLVPAGSGTNAQFPTPLATAANAALTATVSSGVTTIYCNAQGYKGS